MIRRLATLPLIVLALAGAAGSAVILGLGNPIRSLFVLPFLLGGPGLALVPLMRLDLLPGLTLAVGLSLALDALVSTTMIYANVWSPEATLAVLILVSLVGATAPLLTTSFEPDGLAAEEGS